MDKDYGEWEPWLSQIDKYRLEQGRSELTTEQIAEATKSLECVMQRNKLESVAGLPDRLIEAAMHKINDMDYDLGFITFEDYCAGSERIDGVLRMYRLMLGANIL